MRSLLLLVPLFFGGFFIRERTGRENMRAREGGAGAAADPQPVFAFAGADGGGMGAACDCANVQAYVNGAAASITTSRTGTAICNKKGMTTTGIAAGDLVSCAADRPRVEPDGDGVLGLRKEYQPRNEILRSEEADNGYWTTGSTATRTANSKVAPDGTTTGDTLTDSAAGSISYLRVTGSISNAAVHIASVYVMGGTVTKAQLQISRFGSGDTNTCTVTGLSTTTWTRLSCSVTMTSGSGSWDYRVHVGDTNADQGTIFVWGMMLQDTTVGANRALANYIPTAGSAVQLGLEATTIAWPSGLSSTGCFRLRFTPAFAGAVSSNSGFYFGGTGGSERIIYRDSGQTNRASAFNGTTQRDTTADVPYALNTSVNLQAVLDGTNITLNAGAGSVTGALTFSAPTTMALGGQTTSGAAIGIVSRFIADPSSSPWCL